MIFLSRTIFPSESLTDNFTPAKATQVPAHGLITLYMLLLSSIV